MKQYDKMSTVQLLCQLCCSSQKHLKRITKVSEFVSYFMLRNLLLQFGGLCSNRFCICKPLLCGCQPLHQRLQSFVELLRYHRDAFQLTVPSNTPREGLSLGMKKVSNSFNELLESFEKTLETVQCHCRNQSPNERDLYP